MKSESLKVPYLKTWFKIASFRNGYNLYVQEYEQTSIYLCEKEQPSPRAGGYYRASEALSRKGL